MSSIECSGLADCRPIGAGKKAGIVGAHEGGRSTLTMGAISYLLILSNR